MESESSAPEKTTSGPDQPLVEKKDPVKTRGKLHPHPPGSTDGTPAPRRMRWLWQSQIFPAFWTVTGVLSLTVNIILIIILLSLGQELFSIKQLVSNQLINGLHENFVKMDQARISTTVIVDSTIPVQFTLPVKTNTTVILTKDTTITKAHVSVFTGGLTINNALADIVLPAGTNLPIALDISVVDTTVPVKLTVPVNIPLNQTELHEPFVGLQNVVSPYKSLLDNLPNSWDEIFCTRGPLGKCQ
jgi:hypothetical protein